jgi:tRNA 2-selenouridine synthase
MLGVMADTSKSSEQPEQFSAMLRNALDGQYALVIDARSEREYTEDHLPCAISLPVVDNKEYAEVGTTHRTDKHRAYTIGVSYALKNISRYIDELVARHPKDARMLVYRFRVLKRRRH